MADAHIFWPLLQREAYALTRHRALQVGWAAALAGGIAVAATGDPQSRVWLLFQIVYYLLPLLALLGTVMLVRQDLGEAPLMALLPGASQARVAAKATVSTAYLLGLLLLLVLPSAFGGNAGDFLLLAVGGALVVLVCACLGVWRGFCAGTEVRAYFGALGWWCLLLFGSGALAFAAHQWLAPSATPVATLATLMSNPLESFRIFVFFGLNAVPMNPQTSNGLALWWMAHPLVWLAAISLPFASLPLLRAGWGLRYRAHGAE